MADDSGKRIEQAEYRAKLIEAELNAVKSSKAYKLSKKIGIIKAQIKSDPVGLSKKAARILLTQPKRASKILRAPGRGAMLAQSVAEQNGKYQEWILLNEPDEDELEEQAKLADALKYRPLISIITPVFNPPADVFEELIESVLEQTYTNFELCLGNFGDAPEIEAMITRYAQLDSRVKHYKFEENLGIAGNSNQILEEVAGEFIALLDHDDTLSPDALYENAKMLNDEPYDFIYSDKDKIDERGNRFDPLFKPQVSPEMLLNVNYLTHLNIIRTSIVRGVGGWDPETDGAQDWDLFLRVLKESKHVGFIPKILYHWRVIATSTAMSIDTKPYALENQRRTIDKHLAEKGLKAHATMDRTELIIEWDEASLDTNPVVFLYHSNLSNTHRAIRHIRQAVSNPKFVLLVGGQEKIDTVELAARAKLDVLVYETESAAKTVGAYLSANPKIRARVVICMLDTIHLPRSSSWYERLTGWLEITDVAGVSGRLINKRDNIISSGGLVTPDKQYFPLFLGYPRYYQSYLGNAEWVRNLSILSSSYCATEVKLLKDFAANTSISKIGSFDSYFVWLSSTGRRLVLSPHATAIASVEKAQDVPRPLPNIIQGVSFFDPFSNPNMAVHDPLRLFDDESLPGLTPMQQSTPIDTYQHDAAILANTFDITEQQMTEIRANNVSVKNLKSVAWILPSFDAVYAGLMNIFSFANYLAETQQLQTTIYILTGSKSVAKETEAVVSVFPALKSARFVAMTPNEVEKITSHDLGIATQWATTFPLAKSQKINKKFYFIQDNEANFYPKGSISALVELSYRFGFTAIAGTEGLLEMYKHQYNGDGIVLKSKVDLSAYHPRKDMHYVPKKPYKIFFYARPNMPRNAFELGIAGLKHLKLEMGDELEVITAGATWDPKVYGVDGMFTNLGKIAYAAVPKFYRSVDAGLMFMFSGHPGVTASELMASGCPVVVNEYDDITWQELYQHEKTCLTTLPTASEVARNLRRCLEEPALRKKLIVGGLHKASNFYEGYEVSLEAAYQSLINGKPE